MLSASGSSACILCPAGYYSASSSGFLLSLDICILQFSSNLLHAVLFPRPKPSASERATTRRSTRPIWRADPSTGEKGTHEAAINPHHYSHPHSSPLRCSRPKCQPSPLGGETSESVECIRSNRGGSRSEVRRLYAYSV